jgi:antitoxin ParD1/3/4
MNVVLTKELEALVEEKVSSGLYADASDVMRDALRALEGREGFESPYLEEALLEGVRSVHRAYTHEVSNEIRAAAQVRR